MERKPFPGIKVLVADDNSLNRMVTKSMLQKWGITVSEAADGAEALELLRKGAFDILLFDLDMPVVDGLTALREVRRTDTFTPVIAFTGSAGDHSHSTSLQNGFSDFLRKPFTPDQLYDKISVWASK